MSVLRCPADHAQVGSPAEVAIIDWDNVREGLLAQGRCPACPSAELIPGTTTLFGRERAPGRCPCCSAMRLTDYEHGWTCLHTGRLSPARTGSQWPVNPLLTRHVPAEPWQHSQRGSTISTLLA